MGIRKFRPVTPGQRHKAIGTFDDVTTSVPEKTLVFGKRSTGGRNNSVQIQEREGRNSRSGEDYRVRSKPFCAHRTRLLC